MTTKQDLIKVMEEIKAEYKALRYIKGIMTAFIIRVKPETIKSVFPTRKNFIDFIKDQGFSKMYAYRVSKDLYKDGGQL